MHYECDFREQYEKELQELKEEELREKTPEQEEFDMKQMRWIIEMADMEKSQYEKVLNEEKLDLIHTGYRYLCRVAEIQGGQVVMDMNEDAMIAHISYTAKMVCQSGVGDDYTAKVLGLLMIKFNSVTIWAENGEFTIKVDADYYDEKMVRDLREELERRKIEHRKWVRENQRKEWYE